jgi:GDP-L-fucose synthase
MENYHETGLINIGCGEDISIKELAELIGELVEYDGRFVLDSTKPDGTPRKLLDVSKINSFGWKAKISLREGLKKTIDEVIFLF